MNCESLDRQKKKEGPLGFQHKEKRPAPNLVKYDNNGHFLYLYSWKSGYPGSEAVWFGKSWEGDAH